MTPDPRTATKRCGGCGRTLYLIPGKTFNRKRGTIDGFQPFCRSCDYRQKNERTKGWARFRKVLKGTEAQGCWTQESYLAFMGDFSCHYCGNDVTEWSAGYWVDKINARAGYVPGNCIRCCWPCNFRKSNRNAESWIHDIGGILSRWPRGHVPWDQIGEFKRQSVIRPDMRPYFVSDSTQTCIDFGRPNAP